MSTTYSFVCDECKVKCWAGQGRVLYGYQYIADFLHQHLNCRIRFCVDYDLDDSELDYEDFPESDKMQDSLRTLLPIDKAPKDGTLLLLYDGSGCTIGKWGNGWEEDNSPSLSVEPTHWMPLPLADA